MNKFKYILMALFAILTSPVMGQNSDSIKSEHSAVLPKDSLSTPRHEIDSLKSCIKMMQIEITEKEILLRASETKLHVIIFQHDVVRQSLSVKSHTSH